MTQVYSICIEYLAELEPTTRNKLIEIVYDDACHLKKFSEQESKVNISDITKFMGDIGKHVDKESCQTLIFLLVY